MKSTRPSKIAKNCLKRLPGALEAVTDSESVERKNAMVSSSKPTQCVHRRAAKYTHITTVSPKNAMGTAAIASVPMATSSCRQAST